ncbi:NAD(P)/FAD-dependent oxidoreductase [Bacillus sp. FJAT-45350]|uniref:NAD(P)/FAD-dependent oxidoreductase n=1 Tax=Bacillus sp. FJAT-45350 TaxID=2011014 RepID=UPI000BB9879C|nr:FAD-dependent oxidoreductase [Bacillus sp. FJAT-45350]
MQSYIVIGSGILGASTAYHLAKAGHSVTLVDREDKGQATDAAAGIVCPWLTQRRNKAWYQLVKNGARFYPELIKEMELLGEKNTGYQQVGAISLHTDEEKLEKMMERAYKRREDAPEIGEITRLSAAETKALFPPLSEEYSSIHISGGARVNGRALRDALINVAKGIGATVIYGEATLHVIGNNVTGVKINNQILSAEKVIVTGGAWAKELFEAVGIEFLVSPQKAQIVHLELTGANTNKWPVVMPPNNQYLLAFEDGHIVVGATHEDDKGFDNRVTAGGLHEIFDKALMVAPGLAESTLIETRVGFRPYTPGFLPVIGSLPNYEGVYLANGLGASGLTAGPYLGSELAKLAQGVPTEINLELYDVAGAIK